MSARNKNPDGFGASKVVEAVTQTGKNLVMLFRNFEDVSEKSKAPYDLRITWSLNNDLELEWKHPNQTNGEIKFFTVATTAAQKEQIVVRRPVTEEALTYFYKVRNSSRKTMNNLVVFWLGEEYRTCTFYVLQYSSVS